MIVIVELEKDMTGIYIFNIIIYNFGHQKELHLIILIIIHKNSEIGFYSAILSFSLRIGL